MPPLMIAIALNAPITERLISRLPARRDTFLLKKDDTKAHGEVLENISPLQLKHFYGCHRAFKK